VSRGGNSQDPPETPALEDIQLRLQDPGECPGFGAIQEDWKNVRLEQAELCVNTDTGLPDHALEAAHAVSRDGNTPTYLRPAAPVRLHMGAKIAKTADELHLVACHQDMVGYRALNTDWLDLGFGPADFKSESRCLLTHCLQGVYYIPTRLRQKGDVISVVQVGKPFRPNVDTQTSLRHSIVKDFIHRPQEQIRSHPTALTYASVDSEPLGDCPIHADRTQCIRVLKHHEVDDFLWHSMGPQQAPDRISIHRVKSRPQVHVCDPERLAKFQPGLHDAVQRENAVSIVDLAGVKPLCSLRLSSCRCI